MDKITKALNSLNTYLDNLEIHAISSICCLNKCRYVLIDFVSYIHMLPISFLNAVFRNPKMLLSFVDAFGVCRSILLCFFLDFMTHCIQSYVYQVCLPRIYIL